MKHSVLLLSFNLAIFVFISCLDPSLREKNDSYLSAFCNDNCKTKGKKNEPSCKLTDPELQERKATVLATLRKQILETKELENGYSFKFSGTDKVIDELNSFIKSEQQCCDFFTFNISITGDTSFVLLEISGPPGTKEFIKTEMEM